MSSFLAAGINFKLANNYEHRFDLARFTLMNHTNVHLATSVGNYATDLKSSESFQFAGKKKKLEWKMDHSDYSGINKKFITPDGIYDPTLAFAEFARATTEKRSIKEETTALLATHTQADSHEAFIYNMLLSWMRAYLYWGQSRKDGILRVQTTAYVDTHAIVHLDQPASDHIYEVQLEAPVPVEVVLGDDWQYRNAANKWLWPFVVRYSAATKKQEYFYLSHLAGRTNASALNGEFNFAGVPRMQTALDPVGGTATVFDDEPDIDWSAKDQIWQWIIDYVHINRLEQQFASAFESLLTMAVHPEYATMESTAWHAAPLRLMLPCFSPTRAKISLALEGEAYVPSAGPHDFMINDAKAPAQCVLAAAMTNYYMYVGLYALLENQAASVSDWHYVTQLHSTDTEILNSPYAKAAAVSVITGREYTTLMTDGCHAYVDVKPMAEVNTIHVYNSPDNSVLPEVRLRYIPSIVSGALINGSVVGTYESCSHLTAVQQLHPRDAFMDDTAYKSVLQISNVYREFGHDTTWELLPARDEVTPYGPVHSCVIDPYSLGRITDRPYCAVDARSFERAGRHSTLPPIQTLFDEPVLTVRKLKPTITVTTPGARHTPVPPVKFYRRKPITAEFKIRTGATSNRVLLNALRQKEPRQGFHDAKQEIAPSYPLEQNMEQLRVADTPATTNDA